MTGSSSNLTRWRWVAHPPGRSPAELPGRRDAAARTGRPPAAPAPAESTPRYAHPPRWGLPMVVAGREEAENQEAVGRRRTSVLARHARGVLSAALLWSTAASVLTALRYGVLVVYAQRLAPWWLDALSSIAVWVFGCAAFLAGLCAAVAAIEWLVVARRRTFDASTGGADPRPAWMVRMMCLLPVVNLSGPTVLAHELLAATVVGEQERGQIARSLRWWWRAWVVTALLGAGTVLLGLVPGPQAAADRVLLQVFAYAGAALVAWLTRAVIRSFDDTSPRLTRRLLVRGILEKSENPEV